MDNTVIKPSLIPDKMPDVLLAALFPSTLMVIPEEYARKTGTQQKDAVAQKADHHLSHPTNPEIPDKPETPVQQQNTLETLIQEEQEIINKPIPGAPITWLGNFEKKVLVVVNDPTALHLNEQDFALLEKILSAAKISIADVAIVNNASNSLNYKDLQDKLPAVVGLYFGIEPFEIGVPMQFPHYQVQPWGQCTFLYVPAFSNFQGTSAPVLEHKKKLWEAIKKIFNPK